ncbi:N-acetylgalactosaminyltransferase 6 [Armadillidium nasatum]|uniref:Polypeptide N-acetylgalactosaminyltransferase n=1 Tax=Armadillidium nasatum TaxID=96803 RepID=A0A5N5SL36_9CRUS|nr:N-acetylgalactosaminyltransferase 6 [Armadillidium nasatum]
MKAFLKKDLDDWLKKNIPIAKVVRLPERVGLINARQEGVKASSADVIVVLDSHCEVMTDWLPPLLEPIVENPRTAVCPLIDVINSDHFGYYPQDEGGRGAFDWRFYYKRLPLRNSDIEKLPRPFENPVMNGGLFAISRTFFWELGGYDEGLKIWGGEQYDLSFKIWQCGGRLLDAPCSRVGHIFRMGGKNRPAAKNAGDFLSKNYKRVALVWMDEYIEALYKRNPRLRKVDAGDITSELQIRENLQCKPFKWFLENIAPDLVRDYPPIEPSDFANGSISSTVLANMCLDTGSREKGDIILYVCHGFGPQYFSLGYKKNIKVENEQFCWAAPRKEGTPPQIEHCHKDPGPGQIWRYDPETQQIQEKAFMRCLDVDTNARTLFMTTCDPNAKSQKWIFKNVDSALIAQMYPHI